MVVTERKLWCWNSADISRVAVIGMMAAAGPAAAQTGEADPVPIELGPITVEAERGSVAPAGEAYRPGEISVGPLGNRPASKVPFSVTSIPRNLIDNLQASKASDVLRLDPSVQAIATRGSYFEGIWVRGFNLPGDNQLYDGIAGLIGGTGAIVPIDTIERLDLIKGPVGAFYGLQGFGGVGGVLNYVPRKAPEGSGRITDVETSYESRSVVGGNADVGTRFGPDDAFGVRLSGGYERGSTAVELTDLSAGAVALDADWRPAPTLKFESNLLYIDYDIDGYQNPFALTPGLRVPNAPDASQNYMQPWGYVRSRSLMGFTRGTWEFAPGWTIEATGAYQRLSRPYRSPGNPLILNDAGDYRMSVGVFRSTSENYNAQTMLRGKVPTGPLTHNLSAGLDYRYYDARATVFRTVGTYFSNLDNPVYAPKPPNPDGLNKRQTTRSVSRGLFLADWIDIGEKWSLLGGVRFNQLRYDSYSAATGARTARYDEQKPTPVVALTYQPIEPLNLYASYSQSLERGGTAPVGTINALEAMPPIDSKQYEVGAKLELGGMTVNTALFWIKRALEYTAVLPDGNLQYVQSGEQVHRGLEVFAIGEALPGLTLGGGVTLLDPKIETNDQPTTDGNEPPGVPKTVATLYADYELPFAAGLHLIGAATFAGDQYLDTTNNQKISSWQRYDLGLRYEFDVQKRPLVLRFDVENVLDDNYWSSGASSTLSLGAPRTFRLALEARF